MPTLPDIVTTVTDLAQMTIIQVPIGVATVAGLLSRIYYTALGAGRM